MIIYSVELEAQCYLGATIGGQVSKSLKSLKIEAGGRPKHFRLKWLKLRGWANSPIQISHHSPLHVGEVSLLLKVCSKKAEIPIYSFAKHAREEATTSIYSPHVLILEGIFALYDPRVLELLDMRVRRHPFRIKTGSFSADFL